ncbi:MAG: amino acid adenylation domain-containing protein [Candidatus Omnitrophica bacterium]|nr:amino acid adenylation domain-containing protein [Candidatus Omnitrophota bacterium]
MTITKSTKSIVSGFLKAVGEFPDRPALEVDDQTYTYQQLGKRAQDIAASIKAYELTANSLAGVLGYRSFSAYAGVLGVLISGKGYVPLNPEFPTERTFRMISLSKVNVLIVGNECLKELKNLLPLIKQSLTIILPDTEAQEDLVKNYPVHRYIFSSDMPDHQDPVKEPEVDGEGTAYLLFTSGSTGIPKGVPVSHNNVISYVEYICDRYDVNEHDRFSQTFDMTFDLSVHDMFVCWQREACLCSIPQKSVMAPAKFINEKKLTMWFSVPSVAMFMSKFRMLNPGVYPTLRCSLFCGEPFSSVLAAQWQEAAPNSVVENLYGPTEATIAISYHTWDSNSTPEKCTNGIVPIGTIFDGQKCRLIDKQHNVAATGQPGELCLSGSQVTKGYLNNPEKTRSQYIKIPSVGENTWYRTGDLVKQDEDGCLYYLGRIDNQVQILGHRVELQEVDHALRKASGTEMALSVAWPIKDGMAAGVVGFIGGQNNAEEAQIFEYCRSELPEYMVPRKLYFIKDIPLNSNGKMDRLQLKEMLDKGMSA